MTSSKAFDKDDILEFTFSIFMDFQLPDSGACALLSEDMIITGIAASESGIPKQTMVVGKLLDKYGPDGVVRGCLRAFEEDALNENNSHFASTFMYIWMQQDDGLQRRMVEAGVHLALLRRYWKWARAVRRPSAQLALIATIFCNAVFGYDCAYCHQSCRLTYFG